jgi:hypothetical protein
MDYSVSNNGDVHRVNCGLNDKDGADHDKNSKTNLNLALEIYDGILMVVLTGAEPTDFEIPIWKFVQLDLFGVKDFIRDYTTLQFSISLNCDLMRTDDLTSELCDDCLSHCTELEFSPCEFCELILDHKNHTSERTMMTKCRFCSVQRELDSLIFLNPVCMSIYKNGMIVDKQQSQEVSQSQIIGRNHKSPKNIHKKSHYHRCENCSLLYSHSHPTVTRHKLLCGYCTYMSKNPDINYFYDTERAHMAHNVFSPIPIFCKFCQTPFMSSHAAQSNHDTHVISHKCLSFSKCTQCNFIKDVEGGVCVDCKFSVKPKCVICKVSNFVTISSCPTSKYCACCHFLVEHLSVSELYAFVNNKIEPVKILPYRLFGQNFKSISEHELFIVENYCLEREKYEELTPPLVFVAQSGNSSDNYASFTSNSNSPPRAKRKVKTPAPIADVPIPDEPFLNSMLNFPLTIINSIFESLGVSKLKLSAYVTFDFCAFLNIILNMY